MSETNNNKYIKGKPGYLIHHKKMYGLISLIGFGAIILIFTISYIVLGTPKNYFNIGSVLILLPTVKFYVQYSMLPWKNVVDPNEYEDLCAIYGEQSIFCELLITGSEKRFEILYMAIDSDETILAYTKDLKASPALFEKAVVNFLNYYNYDAKVKLYQDYNAFHEAVAQQQSIHPVHTEKEQEHIQTVFEKVSIMSI